MTPTDPDRFIVDLKAVADPLAATNHYVREPSYRLRLALKVLLRSFGLRCTRVAPALPPEPDLNRHDE